MSKYTVAHAIKAARALRDALNVPAKSLALLASPHAAARWVELDECLDLMDAKMALMKIPVSAWQTGERVKNYE